MCIFFLAVQPSSPYVLIAANNRDEFLARNTKPAAFWEDQPGILAGRDISTGTHGGTWFGVSRDGKMATLTNIRSTYHRQRNPTAKSRGYLVSEFLQSGCNQSPLDYCQSLCSQAELYEGFNIITARFSPTVEAAYCSNREPCVVQTLKPGIYGLSNGFLDSPWKKVTQGKQRFTSLVTALQDVSLDPSECERQLLDLLCDDTCLHPDENIPTMGFPEESLKCLSSVFVPPTVLHGVDYGTRTNTVVMISASGKVTYTERTRLQPVDLENPQWETNRFTFDIECRDSHS